ncbi:MAG: monovalent cation/H(+) antiporter subunit G [Arenicellales bacterium]|jgi:multicomponent Na+:H+ antiporter subunit G
MILQLLSWALLLAGGGFVVVGGIGLLRLPDFFTRLHAVSIPDTLGAALIGTGLMIQAGFTLAALKLVLILAFMWFTGPTATHALAKTALHRRLRPRFLHSEEDT